MGKHEHVQSVCLYNMHAAKRDQVRIWAREKNSFISLILLRFLDISILSAIFFFCTQPRKIRALIMCLEMQQEEKESCFTSY